MPEQQDVVWFTAVETELPEPELVPDPGPAMSKAQISSYEPIVNGFVKNHERLLARTDIRTQIERIENIFIALGRFHEIVAIYRDDVAVKGVQSHIADRLAWAYVRLGQRKLARDLLDELLVALPDNASVHFLDGAYWIQIGERTPEELQKVVSAWRRLLELDPQFVGPEGLDAAVIAAEVEKFEQQLEATPPAEPSAIELAKTVVEKVATAPAADAPEAIQQPAQPTQEPKTDQPQTNPPTTTPPTTNHQQYRLLVAKGQIALSNGDARAAENHFLAARRLNPTGFEAEFGRLQAGWTQESARNTVAEGMRKLAQRDDLTPRQKYDLGVFLWTKMSRADIARPLLEAVVAEAPDLATRLDVPGLLQRMK